MPNSTKSNARQLIDNASSHNPNQTSSKREIIENIPWLLELSIDYLLSDIDYQKNPNSNTAVAIGILAGVAHHVEGVKS